MPETLDVGSAALLGAVQGATEFLPVSSSGHVALTSMLLGVSAEMPLSMIVLLHFGTFLATVGVFAKDLRLLTARSLEGLRADPRAFLATDHGRTVAGVVLASIPTAIIGLGLESRVEAFSRVGWIVGLGLLASAGVVWSTRRGGGGQESLTLGRALIVGVAQGIAVLPGVSRSGTTIAVAMMLGMSGPAAFRFSFLLSLPAVAGATLLSLRHTEELRALGVAGVVGGVVSAIVGLAALLWLRALVNQGRFWAFAIYLLPLGLGLVGHHVYTLYSR
ncbi:MAG: undecaprenyl-diphosphate phosphatase [Sandaracinaceae bacterium]|nr:undecaprenyl-diphosphate phosphatase [Sandaracinaceae bacterium]